MGSLTCVLLERIDTDQPRCIFPLLSQGPAVIRFRPRHHGVAIGFINWSAGFIPHDGHAVSEIRFSLFANPCQLGPLSDRPSSHLAESLGELARGQRARVIYGQALVALRY